jgi:hypothetical protein
VEIRTTSPPVFCLGQNQKRAFDIHAFQPPERFQINFHQRTDQCQPRVHHHDVHAAPSRTDLRKSTRDGRRIGHIHRHTDDAGRVALLKFRDEAVQLFAGQIRDGDMTSALQQSPANAVADRTRRAGDQRRATNQSRIETGSRLRFHDLKRADIWQ